MSRPVQPGDLAAIVVGNTEYPYVISSVSPDYITADRYALILTTDGWQVQDYITPHTVKFYSGREQLLSGVKDVDTLILLDLDYKSLLAACSTEQYTNKICQDDFFWRQKVEKDMGSEVMKNKLPDMSYREQYRTLTEDMKMEEAFTNGRLDYIIYKKHAISDRDLLIAAMHGWINILEYTVNHGLLLPYNVTYAAVAGGQINVLQWLYNKNIPFTDGLLINAVDWQHKNVVEWLLNHGITPKYPANVANAAALGNNVDMLNFLESKGILPNEFGFIEAVENGHKDAVQWLMDHNIIGENPIRAANIAAENGDIGMLELLESRGIFPNEDGANLIVDGRYRKTVRWLAERGIYPN